MVDTGTETDFLDIFSIRKIKEALQEKTKSEDLAPSPYADNYKMNHPRRGTAIIFNHVNFLNSEHPKREGSNKDRDDLTELFHELDFDVLAYDDLTSHEIMSVLTTVSKQDHSECDCVVVVVMSHGNDNKLYAYDRDYPTKMLWKYFDCKNCPTLAGKPKLFFIQACRGSGLHEGYRVRYGPGPEEDSTSSDHSSYTIPLLADILIMYSTVEGFFSFRNPNKGTYFIQSLVKQFKTYHTTKDLLTILTFVNREVAVDFTSYELENPQLNDFKQMCSIVSMLTRLLYFTNKRDVK